MSFNKYYLDELVALRELGREYADANPGLAHFLSTPGGDPDVERILEGFAFLGGRLRQKLDDELPEITHSLFSLLWPNYLRTIPSCSVIQYTPTSNLSSSLTVPKGTLVESTPVEGTRCTFQTAYSTRIFPLALQKHHVLDTFDTALLALDFALLGGNLGALDLSSLRFFLGGERNIALAIYHAMLKKVKEIRVVVKDANRKDVVTAVIGPDKITPVGFAEEEGLFPYPANTFPGYRIVQEYFCFPEKFFFIDVGGLDAGLNRRALGGLSAAREFSLQFVLDEMPEGYESFRKENWQLFCTPVVNLFPLDCSPLTLTHKQSEYRIVPDPRRPYHFNTYSVNRVLTWERRKGGQRFSPFESFEHDIDKTNPKPFYRLRLQPSLKDEGTETYISIMQPPNAAPLPENHVISLELTCSNRLLPMQLALGDIHSPPTDAPGSVIFKNILPVSPPYNPPLEGDMLWRLLSNMTLNYISLTNIDALRAVLVVYDFRAPHDRQRARLLARQLQGMRHIECEETDRMYKGLPLRGARTTLALDQSCYSCEGDMFLFGSVLNEFLALYATVNSFHQLLIVEEKRRKKYVWAPRLGGAAIG